MATLTQQLSVFARVISTSSPVELQLTDSTAISSLRPHPRLPLTTLRFFSAATAVSRRRNLASVPAAASMLSENPVVSDIIAAGISGGIALSLLRFWGEIAKRGIFDQKLTRKLVHVSIGLVFMLCWPLFSSGHQGAILAALIPGVNIIKMLLIGLGIWKDEATVKSMSRFGDHRELLKGPLYYASAITLVCAIYWRSSPIGIATICNLCAGDGLADIVGRRFGTQKLPYNRDKSFAGSIAMATAGFLASIGYMHYFALFGYVEESWEMALGFLFASLAAALVESHPSSMDLDDNLTVPLASILVGSFVF
ncbi:farnesol kinase, chloroplastic [Rhododendron vialii]|uniref:farnesol kinase, chloroplastic n=1 Tax=Rhododendron vialii TaxID=182163 RepID=UPI00265DA657|nr:farnesol kinase, chloroplastic [Rhododendron vialii]